MLPTSRASRGRAIRIHKVNGNSPILCFVLELPMEFAPRPARETSPSPRSRPFGDREPTEILEGERGVVANSNIDQSFRQRMKS